jgi:two-component system sensor histidine kinase DegS
LEGTLSDNGVGFQTELVKSETGFGLAGMEQRVKKLGGEFLVKSSPGSGTKISFFVPVAPQPERRDEVESLPAA